ncbi:MAG: SRPBCC family protein [Bacteroidota bacterium]
MTLTRRFDAPLEKVWKAWTLEEEVMKWWGPLGFTCPMAKMNVVVGAASLVCMRAPQAFGGAEMYNTWRYQSIEPGKHLQFMQGWADKNGNRIAPSSLGLPPGIPDEVPHLITFRGLSSGGTEIAITETGYANAQVVEISRAGMMQCLDKMEKALLTSATK